MKGETVERIIILLAITLLYQSLTVLSRELFWGIVAMMGEKNEQL